MGILVVVVFFAGVTLALAWLGGGPDVPHAVDGDPACTSCHPVDGLPDGHHDRVDDSCRFCHSENSADARFAAGAVDIVGSADDGSF